jgi:hypothetical protein
MSWGPKLRSFEGWGSFPGWYMGLDWGPLHVHLEKGRPRLPWIRGLVLVGTWHGKLWLRANLTGSTARDGDCGGGARCVGALYEEVRRRFKLSEP